MVGDSFGRAAWGRALAALMVGFIVGGLVSLRWRPRHGLYAGTALLSLTAAAVGFDRWLMVVGIVMGGVAARSAVAQRAAPGAPP